MLRLKLKRHCERSEAIQKRYGLPRQPCRLPRNDGCNIIKYIIIIFLFFISTSTSAQAADYAPGSVGDLYQSCQQTLAQSESLPDAYQTRCGAFIEGYLVAALSTNWEKLPEPHKEDPCYADKKQAYGRVNNRMCKSLPIYDPKMLFERSIVDVLASTVERWARFDPEALKKPAAQGLGTLVQPGDFCDSLEEAGEEVTVDINPALEDIQWRDILALGQVINHEAKYQQCQADIAAAGDDPAAFKQTRCGAGILGFIAGLHVADHVFDYGAHDFENPACRKQISRFYKALNVSDTMCADVGTSPLLVAKIFTQNYDYIREQKQGGGLYDVLKVFGLEALGYVGQSTIYHGFLCRNGQE